MSDIIITGLNKSYGDRRVLSNVSLVCAEGCAVCIMGPSGCGKSTLLRMIMGIEQADSGSIEGLPDGISAVFQEDRLCEDFSAITNIHMVTGRSVSDGEILRCFEKLGIRDSAYDKVINLSGGMKRRVAIARALLAKHELLVLDEPFKGLDSETRENVIKVVKNDRSTKIMVSHDIIEARLLGAEVITPAGMIERAH